MLFFKGNWTKQGTCDAVCKESDVPLDIQSMTITWNRVNGSLLGDFTCNAGYNLNGEFSFASFGGPSETDVRESGTVSRRVVSWTCDPVLALGQRFHYNSRSRR